MVTTKQPGDPSTSLLLTSEKAVFCKPYLGKPSFKKSAVFFNIVQKAFDPPPLSFEHHAEFAVSAGGENLI